MSRAECETALDKLVFYINGRNQNGISTGHICTGLGETGLDFRDKILKSGILSEEEARSHQIEFFENQIELAKTYKKPLVLHIVQAHEKALQIFDIWGVPDKKGMIHAFNGSFEIAKKYIDLGFYISIGGAVTFDRNQKLKKAVEQIPLEFLLLETDSPDQPPQNWVGLNDSSSLWQVAEVVGQLKSLSAESILQVTTENFKKLFRS